MTSASTPESGKKTWEVEQKYRVADHRSSMEILLGLGGKFVGEERQEDTYFRHPCRDFRATDEALRIRAINDDAVVTYKGPRIPGPVKTRPETELPLAVDTKEQWISIFVSLGFVVAAKIAKVRQVYSLSWSDLPFTIAFDKVEGIGMFVEVETLVHDLEHREETQRKIQALASSLGLESVESRSYLGMHIENRGAE